MAGQRLEQLVGQGSQRPAAAGLVEAGEQPRGILGRRRHAQQAGAEQEVAAGARGGVAAHQPAEQLAVHQGPRPDGRIIEQGEHRLGVAAGPGLDRPPYEQRQARIVGILVMAHQARGDRQAVHGRQPPRRAGELGAHLDLAFARGELAQPGADGGRQAGVIAAQAHRPGAHLGLRMGERRQGGVVVEPAAEVEGPERLRARADRASRSESSRRRTGDDGRNTSPRRSPTACRAGRSGLNQRLGLASRSTSSGRGLAREIEGRGGRLAGLRTR